jgi:hypothetical protein
VSLTRRDQGWLGLFINTTSRGNTVINRTEAATALAKVIAYKNLDNDELVKVWLEKLIKSLEVEQLVTLK